LWDTCNVLQKNKIQVEGGKKSDVQRTLRDVFI